MISIVYERLMTAPGRPDHRALAEALRRRVPAKTHELHTLLPWNWKAAKAVEVPSSA